MTVPMDKPCTHCAVGWMRVSFVVDGLKRCLWVWFCGACHQTETVDA